MSVTPNDLSWKTMVTLYAMRGVWCATARLIWRDGNYPARLVAECTLARETFLARHTPTPRKVS